MRSMRMLASQSWTRECAEKDVERRSWVGSPKRIPIKYRALTSETCIFGIPYVSGESPKGYLVEAVTVSEEGFSFSRLNGQHQRCLLPTQFSSRGIQSMKSIIDDNRYQLIDWYLRNRKHVPCFYRVIQTRVEVWESVSITGSRFTIKLSLTC